MYVVSLCPLRVSGLVWQPRAGAHALTVICKATFLLHPDEAVLAPASEQEEPNETDNPWNDDPRRSLYAVSDRVPLKPRAEVLLVGHAFAPKQQPVRSLVARMVVGDVDKSIEVWCDRGFREGQLLEGPRFAKMPLRWERAAGGPETSNPVGIRFDAAPDMYGMVAIPNLQPMGVHVARRGDTFGPIGFGPMAGSWPRRVAKLHRYAGSFAEHGWEAQPLPDDFDYGYFNTAPVDQEVDELREDERIVLENLHPEHARLVTRLPGIRPRAVVERAGGAREDVVLRADTLWIDTDRGRCTVIWRGRIGLAHVKEAGRITVTMEDGAAGEISDDILMAIPPGSSNEGENDGGGDQAVMTLVPGFAPRATGPVMPFLGGGKPQGAPAPAAPRPADSALPFGQGGLSAQRASDQAPLLVPGDTTMSAPMARGASTPTMAAVAPPPAPPPPPVSPPPPPLVVRPTTMEPIAPPATASPWGPSEVAGKASIGQLAVDAMVSSGAVPKQPAAEPSPAAAAPTPTAKRDGREIVDLLWFSPTAMPRIRKHPAWKEILADVKPRPEDGDLDDDMPPGKRPSAKDRRDVLAILARGQAMRVEDLEQAMMEAVDEYGAFVPPLVLVAGELEFPFDEVETLKALVAAASPLVMADKKLKETVEAIHDVFKMPWVQGATSMVEGLTAQLRDALAQNRAVPLKTIEAHAEMALLEHRHFQKKLVMGQVRIRGLLSSPGGHAKTPIYLPEAVGKELPGFQKHRARLLGELRVRLEPTEGTSKSVRVTAIAIIN